MTQRLLSIGDDYVVETAAGEPAFAVDGKALRVRETLAMTDLRTGDEYGIQERLARARETMDVEKNGRTVATVHRALVGPLRDRFSVSVKGAEDLRVVGNVVDHEYRIERDGAPVATVSKAWFRARDTYGIDVSTAEDVGLVVACAVVIDTMVRPDR
jgi:uncharacterized protein YxjI